MQLGGIMVARILVASGFAIRAPFSLEQSTVRLPIGNNRQMGLGDPVGITQDYTSATTVIPNNTRFDPPTKYRAALTTRANLMRSCPPKKKKRGKTKQKKKKQTK
jgi:hypothetical protein